MVEEGGSAAVATTAAAAPELDRVVENKKREGMEHSSAIVPPPLPRPRKIRRRDCWAELCRLSAPDETVLAGLLISSLWKHIEALHRWALVIPRC